MTKTNMDLTEFLQKHDQGDLQRSIAEAILQLMMEIDVDGLIGARCHERAEQRTTWPQWLSRPLYGHPVWNVEPESAEVAAG